MSVKTKTNKQKGSIAKKIICSSIVGVLLFLLCILLCSAVITKNDVAVSGFRPAIYLSAFFACFAAGFVGALTRLPFKGIVSGIILGGIVATLLLSVMFILNGADMMYGSAVLILAMSLGGIPGGILGANLKQ